MRSLAVGRVDRCHDHMITARLLSGFALGFALLLAGCQTRSSIGEISVTVVDFQPTGSSLLESRAIMTLRFINENLAPVAFSGSTHKLYLNGTYVGKAVNNQAVGIPSASTNTVDVAVFFENLALVKQLASLDRNSEVSYRLTSVLFYRRGDDEEKIKADTSGRLDLAPLLGNR
jgi:LEA14-like dessication related protein